MLGKYKTRNNSASCDDKTRVKACRDHNRAGTVWRGNDFDNDDGEGWIMIVIMILIMMMEGVGLPAPVLPVSGCTIELSSAQ